MMENAGSSGLRRRFVAIMTSHWTHFTTGLLLAGTSLIEIVEEFPSLFQEQTNIGAHHGLFLYGTVMMLHRLAELLEGGTVLGKLVEGREKAGSIRADS